MEKPGIGEPFADDREIVASTGLRFVSAKDITDGLATPLGAIATWPPSLKNVFGILLHTRCPMFLVWTTNGQPFDSDRWILIYNDSYRPHFKQSPQMQFPIPGGQSVGDRWMADWSAMQAHIAQVLATGQSHQSKKRSPFAAAGYSETLSYIALWDETGHIRGVFATVVATFTPTSEAMSLDGVAVDITQHKRTEDTLEQREAERERLLQDLESEQARLEAVLQQMPEGVIIADGASGKVILTNERANQILQHSFEPHHQVETYEQRVLFHTYHPNGQRYAFEDYPLVRSLRTGEVITHEEMEVHYPDGRRIVLDASSAPIFNQQGQISAAIVLIQDITERKKTEQAIHEREQQLRLLTNALPVLITYVDQQRRYRFVNQTYTDWFGLTPENIVGQSVEDVLGPEAYQVIRPDIDLVLSGHKVSSEKHVFFKTAGWRYVQRHFIPDVGEDGVVKGYYALVNDVTDHRNSEISLRQNEEQLRLAQRAAGAGLWDWDITKDRVTWSEEYYQLYGLDETVTPAYETWLACILEPDRAIVGDAVQQALVKQINLNVEFRINHPTKGICWITAIGQTFYGTDGQPARMTGIALDITPRKQVEAEREQLLRREQVMREAAEIAEQRAEFLAQATITLASSLDYEHTLKSVAQAVVPTLADWCAIDILKDDGTLERLATTHVDPAKVQWGMELYRRYPPDLNAPRGLAQVLRTGQSEYYPTISDDLIVASARDEEHLQILRDIGFSSAMMVPLNARGRTLGTISFVAAESGRSYSPEDLSLAEELARRAAIALDNARLYQEAQQARQVAERAADRTIRLQTVTAALSESLTPEQVAEVIVEQSMATLAATAALVVLTNNDRTELEIAKAVGYQTELVESWRKFSINADVPLAEAIRSGKPVWVETVLDRIARYPHLAEIYSRYDFQSWIAIPLVVEGRSIGGLLLSFREFKHLDRDDREFILALSRQCAQAIVRAQLYAAEQQARTEAEQANRIKDEFLAVLSHELRSPLNPILGWTKLLQTHQFNEADTKRALATIERNAKLQTQLIDDLLDVSRILRGKMVLDICPVNLQNVIDAALETVRLAAEAKSITIHKVIAGDMVSLVSGDSGRLQQIVWNLLSNAVKFTPNGGQVKIRLEQNGNHAQIQVKDTGKGITPAFLPHVFDHFRQEDSTITRKFGGLGLGLAIVRYLTELHGGTIQANSPGEGLGATFTVNLPLMKTQPIIHQAPQVLEPHLDLQGVHVLVVEDEVDTRELIQFLLTQAGANVSTAASAREALITLTSTKPDILLSDIGMPDTDGYTLMQQVRALPAEQGGRIPAIALTAFAAEFDQQQAMSVGFQRHVSKPVEPETLVREITALLEQTRLPQAD